MSDMRFLEDELIRLRAVEPEDAEKMWEMECDSRQWRDNGMSAPYSLLNLKEYALSYDANPIRAGQLRLVCEIKDGDEYSPIIGLADIFDISPIGRTAFVGVYVKESRRNRGYGARMLGLLERYSFEVLNLRMLAAKVSSANGCSISMFRSAGYEKCGELPDWLLHGKRADSLLIFSKKLG